MLVFLISGDEIVSTNRLSIRKVIENPLDVPENPVSVTQYNYAIYDDGNRQVSNKYSHVNLAMSALYNFAANGLQADFFLFDGPI